MSLQVCWPWLPAGAAGREGASCKLGSKAGSTVGNGAAVFALPRGLVGGFQIANKAGRGCGSKKEVSARDLMHPPSAPVPAGDKEQRFPHG